MESFYLAVSPCISPHYPTQHLMTQQNHPFSIPSVSPCPHYPTITTIPTPRLTLRYAFPTPSHTRRRRERTKGERYATARRTSDQGRSHKVTDEMGGVNPCQTATLLFIYFIILSINLGSLVMMIAMPWELFWSSLHLHYYYLLLFEYLDYLHRLIKGSSIFISWSVCPPVGF